jgi:SAM-dependent methyltransferase
VISDSTRRFSSRVDNYKRYRPGYPVEVFGVLRAAGALRPDSVVADIGSGTGIFSALLLENGHQVFAVEPNEPMRAAAEERFTAEENFTSVPGTAEATTLPAASIDLITSAQAFHWFDREPTRAEFARILRPGGWVALIWNERQLDSTPLLRAYESLLREFGRDYLAVRHQELGLEKVRRFFGHDDVQLTVLKNAQSFDYAGLEGRLLSSSYAPESGQPSHAPMLARLRAIFDEHADGGTVELRYDTQVYCAQIKPL